MREKPRQIRTRKGASLHDADVMSLSWISPDELRVRLRLEQVAGEVGEREVLVRFTGVRNREQIDALYPVSGEPLGHVRLPTCIEGLFEITPGVYHVGFEVHCQGMRVEHG